MPQSDHQQISSRDIAVWEYRLVSHAYLNTKTTRRVHRGALLRIGGGYGCVHPWPEFGDAPLEQLLERAKEGSYPELVKAALSCAHVDAEARARGVSIFEGLTIPRSHYSWDNGREMHEQVELVLNEGWPAIKMKGDTDPLEAARKLNAVGKLTKTAGTLLRMDFNGCLSVGDFLTFWAAVDLDVRSRVDFIEDPVPYEAQTWDRLGRQCQVSFALDKGWQDGTGGFEVVIVKPSRRDWRRVVEKFPGVKVVMTSAMDHAIGQVWAAYQAAMASGAIGDQISLCGLCTQHLFEPDEFFPLLKSCGGRLVVDRQGGGMGFGQILERLDWIPLKDWKCVRS